MTTAIELGEGTANRTELLALENREQFAQACQLFDLNFSFQREYGACLMDDFHSPWIVLDDGSSGETPRLGAVERSSHGPRGTERFIYKEYLDASTGKDALQHIKQQPVRPSILASGALEWVATFGISRMGISHDEITVESKIRDRLLPPIGSLRKAAYHSRVQRALGSLSSAAAQFEAARRNPALNPLLAELELRPNESTVSLSIPARRLPKKVSVPRDGVETNTNIR